MTADEARARTGHEPGGVPLLRHRGGAASFRLSTSPTSVWGKERDVESRSSPSHPRQTERRADLRDSRPVRVPRNDGLAQHELAASSARTRGPVSERAPASRPPLRTAPRAARGELRAAARLSTSATSQPAHAHRRSSAPPAGEGSGRRSAWRDAHERARRCSLADRDRRAEIRSRVRGDEHRRRVDDVLARGPEMDEARRRLTDAARSAAHERVGGIPPPALPAAAARRVEELVRQHASTIASAWPAGTTPAAASALRARARSRASPRPTRSGDRVANLRSGTKIASNGVTPRRRSCAPRPEAGCRSGPSPSGRRDERLPCIGVELGENRIRRVGGVLVGEVETGHDPLQQSTREHADDDVWSLQPSAGPRPRDPA